MKNILIVTLQKKKFTAFIDALTIEETDNMLQTVSFKKAIDIVSAATPDLVIIDEEVDGTSGLEIAKDILMKNAMVNQAVVSSMSAQEFHDTAEGLGIMAQLSPEPDAEQAKMVLELLEKMP